MINSDTQAIVLAAGNSSRMKSGQSKHLSPICGQAMILYTLRVLDELRVPTTVVLGNQADEIAAEIKKAGITGISYVYQEEQKGTGHAVMCSKETWEKKNILILNGDCPLLTKQDLERLYAAHTKKQAAASFLSSFVLDPTGYGRVVESDERIAIVEEKDCTPSQQSINKINAGVYIFDRTFITKAIETLCKNNASGEYYITDLIARASDQGCSVAYDSVPYDNVRGVNTQEDLWRVEQIKRSELIRYWMSQGVRFELAQNIHIDVQVKLGRGTFIGAGVILVGTTTIGEDCFIGAFTLLINSCLGDNVHIHSHTTIEDSTVGNQAQIGPFARLRAGTVLENNTVVGNYVEIKNSVVGPYTKVKHLAYLGDAKIGEKVNVGAGTITCNHDGVKKNRTEIGDNAYIGSNTVIVAPMKVGIGAITAAGSTLTEDVPDGDLAIARTHQTNKAGYAKKVLEKAKLKTCPAAEPTASSKPEDSVMHAIKAATKITEL